MKSEKVIKENKKLRGFIKVISWREMLEGFEVSEGLALLIYRSVQ